MPQRTPSCQLHDSTTPETRHISAHTGDTQCPTPNQNPHTPTHQTEHPCDYSADRTALVRGAAQEVAHTASRRSGPRRWLRAVRWLIAAGLHPRANATTQLIADDLAARMDYDLGHVRYCMLDIADRLGVDKATVKRHISYLRELGALAWVQHGTLTNIRRALGLGGYAATATVYAAVIPAVYDHAMGHTIVGTGYQARIVIDQRGQAPAPVDNEESAPVENPGPGRCAPPSRTGFSKAGEVQMGGGFNYTSQARQPKPRIPHQRSDMNGQRRTAADVRKAGRTTRLVRALVPWVQSVSLRKLEFELRPFTDQGLDAYQIAADLNGMCPGMRWRPKSPVAFLRAQLAADAARRQEIRDQEAAAARYEQENPAEGPFTGSVAARLDFWTAHQQGLTRYQRNARTSGHQDLSTEAGAAWNAEADILAFLNGSPA